MKFYAEFDTDKIIREHFFPDYNYKGVMVEVGGGTPEFLSMSKHFKDSGWRTIIIEPNPDFVEQHKKYNNEVYQYACSNKDSFGSFTIITQNVKAYGGIITDHSFSSLFLKDSYFKKTNINLKKLNKKVINVEIKKLDSILEKINIKKIDILSIDVEGWELEVMQGLDTKKTTCDIIVVENFLDDINYTNYFNSIDYKFYDKINDNEIYIKK